MKEENADLFIIKPPAGIAPNGYELGWTKKSVFTPLYEFLRFGFCLKATPAMF